MSNVSNCFLDEFSVPFLLCCFSCLKISQIQFFLSTANCWVVDKFEVIFLKQHIRVWWIHQYLYMCQEVVFVFQCFLLLILQVKCLPLPGQRTYLQPQVVVSSSVRFIKMPGLKDYHPQIRKLHCLHQRYDIKWI